MVPGRSPDFLTRVAGDAPYFVGADELEAPFNEVDKGGHSAAWEQPQLFAEKLLAAF